MISKTAQLGGGVFALLLLNTRASPMKDVYEELGCVKDAGHSRVMSAGPYKEGAMSAEICYGICKTETPGFEYFGTQYANECFCARTLSDDLDQDHDGCSATCAGSSDDEICGGSYAMNVYEVKKKTSGRYEELGCAQDGPGGGRIMSGPYKDDAMSAEMCFGICEDAMSDFEYFGTQYAIECYCAKALPDDVSFDPEHDGCSFTCAGNSDETCGGFYSMTVYEVEDHKPKEPKGRYLELGCAKDSKDERIMPSAIYKDDDMSAKTCYGICMDNMSEFEYFGTQFTNQCFCATTLPDDLSFFPEHTGCTATCPGNSDEACGGHDAMTVYKVDDAEHKPKRDYMELGCAQDASGSGRIMSEGPYMEDVMSAEICYDICKDAMSDVEYFGTQYGKQCFCAKSLLDDTSFFPEHTGCTHTCAGSSDDETCGGHWSMTVYQVYNDE